MMVAILVCIGLALSSRAGDPYRAHLLSQIFTIDNPRGYHNIVPIQLPAGTDLYIPRYEIPKGAIFCRMEDKVTKSTKVWLKLGVQ